MTSTRLRIAVCRLALLVLLIPATAAVAAEGLGYQDLMKVRKITHRVISEDGRWVAYAVVPDRGDGEGFVRAVDGGAERVIERGTQPQLTPDGAWAAFRIEPSFAEKQSAPEDDPPVAGLALVRTADGERWTFDRVEDFAFSKDGAWIGVHHVAPEADGESEAAAGPDSARTGAPEEPAQKQAEEQAEEQAEGEPADEEKERQVGGALELVQLADQDTLRIEHVSRWAFDPTSARVAVALATPDGDGNALLLYALGDEPRSSELVAEAMASFPVLAWAEERPRLAFLQGHEEEPGTVTDLVLGLADAATGELRTVTAPGGRRFPDENELRWTRDDQRIFVGLRPAEADSVARDDEDGDADAGAGPTEEETAAADPYDFEAILEERDVDVWHWDDPRIKTHERASWKERSGQLHRAVVHVEEARIVPLADEEMPEIMVSQSDRRVLGRSSEPWLKLMTWDGFYQDWYAVDLDTGARELIVPRTQDTVSLSPRGSYAVYFRDGHWWLVDLGSGEHRNLTEGLDVPFEDEDHDYPRTPPDYGVGGWANDDSSVLLYDKYDVWWMPTSAGAASPARLTEGRGREDQRIYRVEDLDPEKEGFDPGESLLLTGFDEREKNSSLWRATMGEPGLRRLREEDARFEILVKAKEADRILYTEERYDQFPDLRVADPDFRRIRRVSEVNPQLEDFDLGSAELVEWTSLDGVPLQGVLIKPAGYEQGERYPVLVYFYRFFSQRLHEFNDPVINHRPSFYVYAGDGYAVFLPDIRFEVGRPGLSATKCLVPGVQKLVELGVADPDAIALHGHSWSGYQAAQIITQTDIFACAVAGAPVSNMTSAYGGIRWGTGLSRQFQYEQSQSRLGVSLWDGRDRYIDNSPVFFADQIDTPLLIQFGDEDEAVPWTQGIELYMAMRRLGKPAVMLQYRGEPHHLKQYGNKLDYSLKMKAFIDHHCKGAAAPEWWADGVPYEGD